MVLGASLSDEGTRGVVLACFMVFIVLMLLLCVFIGPESDDVDGFYAAGRSGRPWRGAFALAGAYVSAATLGAAGSVAFVGYDGLLEVLSVILSFGVLLVLAAPLRSRGSFTLGGILASRVPAPSVRVAAAVVTLCAVIPFLVMALLGAGVSIAAVLGVSGAGGEKAIIVFFGTAIVCASVFGGMRGTRMLQIIKTAVLAMALAAVAVLVFSRLDGVNDLLHSAAAGSGRPDDFYRPGLTFTDSTLLTSKVDLIGLVLTVVLGAAFMPHVTMHLTTVHSPGAARRMVRHGIVIVTMLCLGACVMGMGAAALVHSNAIAAVDPSGDNSGVLLVGELASRLSNSFAGSLLIVLVVCAAFANTLAVVAGLTLAAAAAISHDLYANVMGRDSISQAREVSAARWASAGVGVLGIGLAILVQGIDLQWVASFAFSVAASCVLPAVLQSLYWRKCTRWGILGTLYAGLISTIVLQLMSPVFSGNPAALIPGVDFAWFPLHTATLVSVPVAVLAGQLANTRSIRSGRHLRDLPATGVTL